MPVARKLRYISISNRWIGTDGKFIRSPKRRTKTIIKDQWDSFKAYKKTVRTRRHKKKVVKRVLIKRRRSERKKIARIRRKAKRKLLKKKRKVKRVKKVKEKPLVYKSKPSLESIKELKKRKPGMFKTSKKTRKGDIPKDVKSYLRYEILLTQYVDDVKYHVFTAHGVAILPGKHTVKELGAITRPTPFFMGIELAIEYLKEGWTLEFQSATYKIYHRKSKGKFLNYLTDRFKPLNRYGGRYEKFKPLNRYGGRYEK